ncbi:MAG: carboxypeptidase regulatory-like domain-containing protein [Gemmatimonadaceae bacterium]|nr:carboxypeptidase regulatory-like domain-containing protein [Gemmatimonadaceae bacterium]
MPVRVSGRSMLLLSVAAVPLSAQSVTDIIRGRVTNDSTRVIVGASVFVTRGPDRAFKQTTTDSAGRYVITFENGTGDYLVAVSSVGLKSARRRVQRQNSERELVADFVLATDVSTLAAVKVTAEKPARAETRIDPTSLEIGASERWQDGVTGQVTPSQIGNLAAIAGTTPGVTQGVSGPSILGSGSESNLTTLNGMALPGGTLPRAARVNTRVTGATFDPVRGGFSGANTDVQLGAGSRNYQQRDAYVTLDAPALQSTDAIGQSLGVRYTSLRGSAGANGFIIPRVATYNASVELSRSTSDPATLFTGDLRALQGAGVSGDSVSRLRTAALGVGVPTAGNGIPAARERTGITWLGRLDDIRDSLNQHQITSYVSYAKDGALGFAPLTATSAGGSSTDRAIGAQLQLSNFLGAGRRVLNQTKIGASQTQNSGDPYLGLPGATVLVRATGSGGDGIVPLAIGGNSSFDRSETRFTAEASNLTMWNARGRRHTFKAFGWARVDALEQSGGADLLGRYSFNSITDFAAGRPASFSRTLTQPARDGTVWNAGGAMAHQWNPTKRVSVLYGARIEGNGFTSSPASNPLLESALGVRTGLAPTMLRISPRIGFSYSYSRAKENGNGMSINQTGTFYRTTSGVLRGGIGEFRDLLRPDVLADAAARTALAGSTQALLCAGAAVPTPDWTRFLADAESIPRACVDGSGVLTDNAPPATLIGRDYQVPRSWRASLDWYTNFGWMQLKWNNLASYDLSQSSVRDVNFAGVQRFTLAQEGDRPVYVSAAGIDAGTGAVSATESRRSAAFGRVGVRGSELRGYGAQTTVTLAPDPFRRRRVPLGLYGSVSWTLQASRRQYLGFDGYTAGDPTLREWAPSANDARHIVSMQGALNVERFGSLTFFARAQSGLPFTPQVQGDINGDGRGGDRAFIPSSTLPVDATLAAQLASLKATGSPTASRCLGAFDGRIVSRNGCRGPWTATMNMQYRPALPKALQRLNASLFFENVLAGVDQVLHGSNGLRGWGGSASPDPVLLVPRAFDVASQSFRYDVNPRFAETRPSRSTLRFPFRVTLDFQLRLATDYSLQELRRALQPVRVGRKWEPRSADSLTALYLGETSNIHTAILAESDSLFLAPDQIVALRKAEADFSDRVRGIYGQLGQYLAQYAGGAASKEVLDSTNNVKKAYWAAFWEQPEIAAALITPTQRDLMPMLRDMLPTTKADRLRSQWMFGHQVKFVKPASGVVAPPAAAGGTVRPPE